MPTTPQRTSTASPFTTAWLVTETPGVSPVIFFVRMWVIFELASFVFGRCEVAALLIFIVIITTGIIYTKSY